MINTLNIKQQQLANTYFKIGSGEEKILIMGSCRVCPILNYFNEWNIQNNNRFTIYSIDPFNWCWNDKDERVDYAAKLEELRTDERLLDMLHSVDIFIHEWYQNAGMFNCDKAATDGIYSCQMNPRQDICIPNWNDIFVLYLDILAFDTNLRRKAIQDFHVTGKLSEEVSTELFTISQANLKKFYATCEKSDLPEMTSVFAGGSVYKRFFHNFNHVTKHFTLAVFRLITEKFLFLDYGDKFLEEIGRVDMFDNAYTKLTDYDVAAYGYKWDEEMVSLKDKIL